MIVTRVYNNGSRVAKEMTPRDGEAEISYNLECRPGCACFRDAQCVHTGYLAAARCADIAEELRIKIEEQTK